MKKQDHQRAKKKWASPKLKVHGTIERLTQVGKDFQANDGVIFIPTGDPIGPPTGS